MKDKLFFQSGVLGEENYLGFFSQLLSDYSSMFSMWGGCGELAQDKSQDECSTPVPFPQRLQL